MFQLNIISTSSNPKRSHNENNIIFFLYQELSILSFTFAVAIVASNQRDREEIFLSHWQKSCHMYFITFCVFHFALTYSTL